MVCRIHSWILFNNVFSRLQMHELRKSPVAKCFTPVMPTWLMNRSLNYLLRYITGGYGTTGNPTHTQTQTFKYTNEQFVRLDELVEITTYWFYLCGCEWWSKDLHSQFNIIYIMRNGRIAELAGIVDTGRQLATIDSDSKSSVSPSESESKCLSAVSERPDLAICACSSSWLVNLYLIHENQTPLLQCHHHAPDVMNFFHDKGPDECCRANVP